MKDTTLKFKETIKKYFICTLKTSKAQNKRIPKNILIKLNIENHQIKLFIQ